MEKDLRKKSEFILGGDVLLPEDFRPPFRLSRSTAGPGAGKRGMVFAFDGMRVKKGVSTEHGDFQLIDNDGRLSILRNDEVFIENVTIEPVIYHSPGQAFFNLDQRCMFRCVFCASPLLGPDATKNLTDERIIEMVRTAEAEHEIPSIALTSGVVGSVQETVDRMAECVRSLRKEFPDKTIGVEPYIDSKDQIDALKEAGADEIKINRETPRKDIFDKVCPDLDHNEIYNMLAHSVDVFGKGKVTSNIIYGMGETDDDMIEEMERLASIGCLPGLRPVKINDTNRSKMYEVLGDIGPVTSEHMMKLAKEQKRIMEKYGLTTNSFRTMCFECQCCDLVPFKDL